MSKATLLSVLILLGVVTLTLLPLFKPGLFDVHDPTSVIRFYTLHESLKAGQVPASWSNYLNQGFGYPLFLFYAPVFSYLGVLLKLLTPSYLLALKIAIVILVSCSSIGMYFLMRRFLDKAGSLVSSLAYTFLPYHAATIYVRGSYAEGVTWAVLPWLLYLWSSANQSLKWISLTGITTAIFFLSHNSLPFSFLPFLIIWILIFRKNAWLPNIYTIILSVGLIAWFLIPVLLERNLVQIESIATSTNYQDHFLIAQQLWHSPWGYGGSAKLSEVDGMSFMLGKFQLVLAFTSLLLIGFKKQWKKEVLFFLATFLFYAFMTTVNSSFLWEIVPTLSILQFPWRMIAFASFGLAGLSGYLVQYLPKNLRLLAMIISITLLIYFNIKFFVPQSSISYNDRDLLSQEKLDTVVKQKIPEYLPAQMPTFPDARADDGLRRTATKVSGQLTLEQAKPITISTAYMPHWQLRLNGQSVDITHTETGLITTVQAFEPGDYQLELDWHRTPLEQLANLISLLSLLVVIGLLLV